MIGGTGPLGKGLALRFALAGEQVLLGSRDEQRAVATVKELADDAPDGLLEGAANEDVCRRADTVFVTVPYGGQADVLRGVAEELDGKLVVSCGNALAFDEHGPHAVPVAAGSAAEEVRALVPGARVVGAFHNVSARKLRRVGALVPADVLLCGDDEPSIAQVARLVALVPGMRPVVAGPLRLSGVVEALTAVLLSVNRRYRVSSGIRVTGLDDAAVTAAAAARPGAG